MPSRTNWMECIIPLLYSDGPDWYVCSDYPVGLFYSLTVSEDPLEHQKAIEWPTLSPFKSPIFMPLAYNVAIAIHRSENIPTALRADRRMVARVNTVVVGYSQRFICSPSLILRCVLPNRQLGMQRTLSQLYSVFENPRETDSTAQISSEFRSQ